MKLTQEMLSEWEAITERASKGPWIADIDDPGTPNETWTGKLYVGLGDSEYQYSNDEQHESKQQIKRPN